MKNWIDDGQETSLWPENESIVEWSVEKPINGKLEIKFNPYEHLRFGPGELKDETLEVKVTVVEELTAKTFTGSTELQFVQEGFETDLISPTMGLRPGTEFYGRIKLTTKDGQPIHDTRNPIKFGYRFKLKDLITGKEKTTEYTEETAFLNHGLVPLKIKVPKEARELNVRLMYKDYRLSLPKVFSSNYQMSNYLQFVPLNQQGNADKIVEVLKGNGPNEESKIHFKIESSEPIARLSYVISVLGKIVHANQIESHEQTLNEIALPFKPVMKNGFHIIAYFLRSDVAEWMTESIEYVPTAESMDTMELSANSTNLRPGETVAITAQTKPISFVAVVGIDQSMILLRKPKYISLQDLNDQQKQLKRSLPIRYSYERNAFKMSYLHFVSTNPVSDIYYAPNQGFNKQVEPAYTFRSIPGMRGGAIANERPVARGGGSEEPMYSLPRKTFEESMPSVQLRKDFPETWLWDAKVTDNSGVATFESTMPDTITSWVVNAFSVSKETGLALPRNPLEVSSQLFNLIDFNLVFDIQI